MALTATAPMPQTPRATVLTVGTANPNRDGTGTLSATSFDSVTNGTIVEYVLFKAKVSTTAGTLRVFYSPDNGTTYYLLGEKATGAVTVSGTVPADEVVWLPPSGAGFTMPGSTKLKFSTENAEAWNVHVVGADF